MTFRVIDKKTGKEADTWNIALHEEWAQGLVYCDMEGFAITEDGTLVLMDECGNVVYCDTERFKVVLEDERPHGAWIPCSERLPEEDGRFLVFLPDRNGTFMCADFLSGKWYQDDYECTSNHVLAWMPLPEPYKKEGDEN